MKKIIFILVAALFCTINYAAATTVTECKKKSVDNVSITIGNWKINGKVNGTIIYSDSKELKDDLTKLGNSDIVTYSNGNIDINLNDEDINNLLADVSDALHDCEIDVTYNDDNPKRIKGSGNIISKTIPAIASYDAIKASRGVRVVMEEREDDNITIKADDNVMPYVVVRKEGNSLIIGIDKNINSLSNLNVEVFLPKNSNLNELKAASGATININTTIESRTLSIDVASAAKVNFAKADVDFFDADASSAAKISGTVKSNDCYVDASSAAEINFTILTVQCDSNASSAAKITLNGETASFEGDASSAAKIIAKGLSVLAMADASASSGAKISVNALKKLEAKASSGGVVTYVHNNDLIKEISQSSGGRVKSEF